MPHRFLDHYSRSDSPLHRAPAALKLAAAVALVVALLVVPAGAWLYLGVAAALLLVLAMVSRIPWKFLIRRLVLLELFVVGVALMALFQPGGWRLCLFLLAKCALCLLAMMLLSNTTPFAEILRVLKAARMPGLLVTTLSLMYRDLFVLVDEAQRMRRARMSRTFTPQKTGVWRARATVLSQLFIRSSERAERIYGAMCARGWR
jgi:cobalt/nickel transport system permease protein